MNHIRRHKTTYVPKIEKDATLLKLLCEASMPDTKTCQVCYKRKNRKSSLFINIEANNLNSVLNQKH